MRNVETVKTTWHRCSKLSEDPQKAGWYLCKITDLLNCSEPYEWGKPYYAVVWYDNVWDCDGVVIAWAEVPLCSFEVDNSEGI